MLVSLLRTHLRPYRTLLAGVLILQIVQVMASLYLPNLNARIIDTGLAQGDTGYIWRIGALMLGVSVLQGAAPSGHLAGGPLGAGHGTRSARSHLPAGRETSPSVRSPSSGRAP